MTAEYDKLREILRSARPSDVVAILLEEWTAEKIDYLMEELELELSDDGEAETSSTCQ